MSHFGRGMSRTSLLCGEISGPIDLKVQLLRVLQIIIGLQTCHSRPNEL